MKSVPISAYQETLGMTYFARMLDKIRKHDAGELREDFCDNLGTGFDGPVVRQIEFAPLRIIEGGLRIAGLFAGRIAFRSDGGRGGDEGVGGGQQPRFQVGIGEAVAGALGITFLEPPIRVEGQDFARPDIGRPGTQRQD